MTQDEELLFAVQSALDDTAEIQVERKIDWIIRDLDELCAMAANPETVDLVEAQRIGVGTIFRKSERVINLLMAQQPTRLRMVINHD